MIKRASRSHSTLLAQYAEAEHSALGFDDTATVPPLTNAMLVTVLQRLADGVMILDREWRITFANAEARRMGRLDSADLNSKSLWDLYPETIGTRLEQVCRNAMDSGTTAQTGAKVEYYHPPYDAWFDVQVIGLPAGVALHYRDVTERKLAEAFGDATTRRLNQVLEAISDATVSVDRDWRYTYLNRNAQELLGRHDLLGKHLWEEFPHLEDSTFSINLRRCMEERAPAEWEAYYPEPLERWFNILCRPADDGMVVFFRDVTERRRSQMIATQQRELITFVQQASRTAFWKLDLQSGHIEFDEGSAEIYGHPYSRLRTMEEFAPIIHPDDVASVTANTQRAIDTGELIVSEFRVIGGDGRTIWIESRSRAEFAEGRPVMLGGMTIDITERKRNEEALAASEQRYRVLTELSPQFLWTGSPEGAITYANQGFLDYLGFTMADIGGDHWLTAFDPEDQPRVVEAWGHSVATGEVYDVEARLIEGRTRRSRWWWLRGLPLRDDAGAIVNWLGVAVDIHERKTAADELRQKQLETERQRAELETLYRTAPIGLALFDPVEFRYLRLNDRQAEIVGLPQEEVLGKRLTEIAPIPGLEEMFQQVASGTPIRNELLEGTVAARPDEHRYWNVNYFPVFNSDGSVRAITAASLEITAQKKTELALMQSEKLAAVGRLASSISHEINNPLEAVTNLLYLIAEDPSLPDELNPFMEMAQNELARVCQIATQTLRFHRQAVRATVVTGEELVGAVLNLYRGRLMNSGITVSADYASRRPLLCLENDIRQVLNNLIANAIDAMRQGGRLLARTHDGTGYSPEHPAGRSGIWITIADTGQGMSPSVMARVFEPFYTTKALNGTGLGLWISQEIITRHHGHVKIRSSDDPERHGTVFRVFLPHISEAEIEEATPLSG
jgi:PAS domain S-box-containing protein